MQKFKVSDFDHPGLFLEHSVADGVLTEVRQQVPILSVESPLCELPSWLHRCLPHPYMARGAEYPSYSPWHLRALVIERLSLAHAALQKQRPGAALFVTDAYRPVSVQAFMIERECERYSEESIGSAFLSLSQKEQARVRSHVMEFWATPSKDSTCPPPHSTGGAIDVTIIDSDAKTLAMGTAIDEISEASLPSFFQDARSEKELLYHSNRQLLLSIMEEAGFHRLPSEWWHFSYGDQLWAVLESLRTGIEQNALFGRVEPL